MKLKAPRKSFAERRFGQKKAIIKQINSAEEVLTGVAIIRDGVTHTSRFHSHWELRYHIDPDCQFIHKGRIDDVCGYTTNLREFISREEAAVVGRASGQVSSRTESLLSSDVNYWPKTSEKF